MCRVSAPYITSDATLTSVNLWGPMVGFVFGAAVSAGGSWIASKTTAKASRVQAEISLEGIRETLHSETERKRLELEHAEKMAELDRAAIVRQHWRDQRMGVYTHAWAALHASGELLQEHSLDLIGSDQPTIRDFAERFEAIKKSNDEALAPLALMGSSDANRAADSLRKIVEEWAIGQVEAAAIAETAARRALGLEFAQIKPSQFEAGLTRFNEACKRDLEL